jgi:L-amino acid N-acyltransferase YncA
MEIKFEIAQLNDLSEIVRIYNQTIPGRMATADTIPVTVAQRRPWFEAHQNPKRPLWVIKNQSEIIGWVSLGDFYGRPAYQPTTEISIYIDQKYQGHQLGQRAIQFAEKQAKTLAIETILAFIFAHNQPSLKLFSKLGYQKWGELPQVAKMDNQFFDLIIMGKRL